MTKLILLLSLLTLTTGAFSQKIRNGIVDFNHVPIREALKFICEKKEYNFIDSSSVGNEYMKASIRLSTPIDDIVKLFQWSTEYLVIERKGRIIILKNKR